MKADPSLTPDGSRPLGRRLAQRSRREIVVIDVLLLAVLLFLFVEALELGEASRLFPVWVIAITGVLVAVDLVRELVPGAVSGAGEGAVAAGGQEPAQTAEEQVAAAKAAGVRPDPGMNQWVILAWVVVLAVLMIYVTYVLVVPIFLGAFFLWVRAPWKVAVPLTVILWLFTWGFFNQLLGLR